MLSSCLGLGGVGRGVWCMWCVCEERVFGGKEWQLSAGGSCRWKTPSSFPSLQRQKAAPTILSARRLKGGQSFDTAKRYPEGRRTSNCNAAHFFKLHWMVLEAGWECERGQGSKIIPRCAFGPLPFLTAQPAVLSFLSLSSRLRVMVIGAWQVAIIQCAH